MGRVVHFEIHAENPERAAQFYRAVFGWDIKKWDGPAEYWLVMTGDPQARGIDGGLLRRPCPAPADGQSVNAFVCTVDVADVDASVKTATDNGGTLALPKMAVPGVGWLAYVKDTEGNILGMMQMDRNAK
jgi:predicted enzyme related to lactoylglutathione lyase